jgi:hypothetical protein
MFNSHDTHDEQQQQPGDLEANLPCTNATPLLPVGSKPHVHCEQCERIVERRERAKRENHCCTMVAATFMMLFICAMVLGIIVAVSKH